MAFQTTQSLDALLTHNLLFRDTANAPISSFYTLYANGRGQTYWAPAVKTSDLSTISTGVFRQISSLNAGLSSVESSFTILSSQTVPGSVSTLGSQIVSSYTSLANTQGVLNSQFNVFSNLTNARINTLSNTLTGQVNATTQSTINIVTSTISGISSISTYTAEFAFSQEMLQSAASTLSTAIALGDLSNYSTLSSFITSQSSTILGNSYVYTDAQFSTLSSYVTSVDQINLLSTSVNDAIVSTTAGLTNTISTGVGYLSSQIYETNLSTLSTQAWINSTLGGLTADSVRFSALSSQVSSLIFTGISSYTESLFAAQDAKFSGYTSTLLNNISSISSLANQNRTDILAISSYTGQQLSSISVNNSTILGAISTFSRELSVLTTSSILVETWDNFNQLYSYTAELINSSINSMIGFRSTVYYSTTQQNMSTGTGFYNQYVSSTYASTLSTMIPITLNYVSTTTGLLYSTGSAALISSVNSTILGQSQGFASTISSLTTALVVSSVTQLNSSILSYLSSPAAAVLSTFTSQGQSSILAYSQLNFSSINAQSTLFYSTYNSLIGTQSTQFSGMNSLLSTVSTSYIQYASTYTSLLSSLGGTNSALTSTQTSQFNSSLGSYSGIFNTALTSTNTAVLTQGISSANGVVSAITVSTNTIYNSFVSSIANSASSIFSTLYTNQVINLTGANYLGTLDFANYTNFTVNVGSPLLSASNYRVTYASNSITNLNYRRGFITVDVSTIGSGYGNNDGRLAIDTYRWGLPTTMFQEFYPRISSMDYTTLYQYTILNNIVYTNLLNVFPRLRVSALQINTGTNTGQANSWWRGSPLNVSWSNYSFFPYGAGSAPAFYPEVMVDVVYGGQVASRAGPYALSVSTATVNLPYLSGAIANPAPVTVRSYIVGKPMDAATQNVNLILPQISQLSITPATGKFLGLAEISAFSDAGTNTLLNITNIKSYDSFGSSNAFFQEPMKMYKKFNNFGGSDHNCFVDASGNLWMWGKNAYGQVGNGTTTDVYSPVNIMGFFSPPLASGVTVISASCGYGFSVAICSDGSIYSWGDQTGYRLGNDVNTGYLTVPTQITGGPSNPATVSCGYNHTIVLCTDGTLWGFGDNNSFQLAFPLIYDYLFCAFTDSYVPKISTIADQVVSYGDDIDCPLQTYDFRGDLLGKTPVWISAGSNYSGVVCADNTTCMFGANSPPLVAYSIPTSINSNGSLIGKNPIMISCYNFLNCQIVCSDYTAHAIGDNRYIGISTSSGTSLSSIQVSTSLLASKLVYYSKAGHERSAFLCTDGTMAVCGRQSFGQLGNNSVFTGSILPTSINLQGDLNGKRPIHFTTSYGTQNIFTDDGSFLGNGLSTATIGIGVQTSNIRTPKLNGFFTATYSTYSKAYAVDGNANTFFIGPVTSNVTDVAAQLQITPNLQTSLTSISSIVIQNLPATSQIVRTPASGINDSQELQGATLTVTSLVGATAYTSTFTLTSSILQSFSF